LRKVKRKETLGTIGTLGTEIMIVSS